MKKWRIGIVVLFLLLLAGSILVLGNKRIKNYLGIRKENTLLVVPNEPVLAVFSFTPGFQNKLVTNIGHYKINLSASTDFDLEILKRVGDDKPVIITIETWGGTFIHSYYRSPLDDLLEGRYDKAVEMLGQQLRGMGREVFLRFNPEMEVPGHYYPWLKNRNKYIDAFRHFSDLCRRYAPQAKLVWAPAGYPGAMEYYPGDAYLDAATVTLKSKSEMTKDYYPRDYEEAYDAFRRLHRLRFLSCPVFVLGSVHSVNEAIDTSAVSEISRTIETNRNVIYSERNFDPPLETWTIPRPGPLKIGFYDPNELLVNEPEVTVEHLFADFGNLADGSFEERFGRVQARQHDVIVTFEPFRHPQKEYDPDILEEVAKGTYDREIKAFYNILLGTKRQIYLRYAHEMEIPITRYPWQSKNPLTYIKSFRYFMSFPDTLPPNIKKVWGPAGDRGSAEWYPGDDMVDYLSMAIYGLPDKNITDPEKQESFHTIFNRKLTRMRFLDKPIFITEFGVKGPEDYQTKWLVKAAEVINNTPRVIGINYFNMSDTPKAWGDIKPPDWSISNATFQTLLTELKAAR